MRTSFSSLARAGAAAGLALAALSAAPIAAQAQSWGYYGGYRDYGGEHMVTRCDRDGDRCATFRCDRDGDACDRASPWRSAYGYGERRYDAYPITQTRCDRDGDRCATFRCDSDGDRCVRESGWWRRW